MTKFFELFAKNARSILAHIITICGFAFLFVLLRIEIPYKNKEIIMVSVGIILATMKDVSSYYFGSSKDKSDRDKADIVQEGGDLTKIIT